MEFSKEQKDFLGKFIEYDTKQGFANTESPFYLLNIIVEVAEIVKIKVTCNEDSERSLEVEYDPSNQNYKGIYSIFEWMDFLNYLRDEGYITVLTMGEKQKDGKCHYTWDKVPRLIPIGKNKERASGETSSEDINNEEIEGIKNWTRECIYPKQKLRELVASEFKTQEQVRFEDEMRETKNMFKKNMSWTKAMVIITAVSIVVTLAIGVCEILKD